MQGLGKPLRTDPNWPIVWQGLIDRCGEDLRLQYMKLKPIPGSDGATRVMPGSEGVGVMGHGLHVPPGFKITRNGDLAYVNGIFCKTAPDAVKMKAANDVLFQFFDALDHGNAMVKESDRNKSQKELAEHNKTWLSNFRACMLQKFIGLNSADWVEIFKRMLPKLNEPRFPEHQMSLESAIKACYDFFCVFQCDALYFCV